MKAAAARRVASAEALRTVTSLFGEPDEAAEPHEILVRELRDAAGTVKALRSLLDQLDPQDALVGPGAAVVELHGEKQQRLIRAAEAAVRLGVEQRSALIAEQLSTAVAALIRRVVMELDLDDEQRRRALEVARSGLRAIAPAPTSGRTL